jgi:SprT protein
LSHPFDPYARGLLEQLSARFPLGKPVTLTWRAYRVSAGMAYCAETRIGLSSRVLKTEEQVKDTLVHEYAHLLAYARHGRKSLGHGEEWKQAMRDLGAEPHVRHRYEVERNQPRQQVVYRCQRCGAEFARNKRFPKGRRYQHVQCGGTLALHQVLRVQG